MIRVRIRGRTENKRVNLCVSSFNFNTGNYLLVIVTGAMVVVDEDHDSDMVGIETWIANGLWTLLRNAANTC